MRHSNDDRRPFPRGVVLLAVVICLLVVMLTAAALVRGVVIQRRQARDQARQLQAYWLAESAYRRAVVMLRGDPNYAGEDWRVRLDGPHGARVGAARIVVDSNGSGGSRVRVTARWPDHPIRSHAFRKVAVIE